jgi:hypothetical protein
LPRLRVAEEPAVLTKDQVLELLRENSPYLAAQYGVK